MRAVAVSLEPASAALVRQAISADLLARRVAPTSVDDVVLVASELVGNAVRHGASADDRGALDVSWELVGSAVVLRVGDHSLQVPQVRAASPDAPNGRGMAIVAAVAEAWGVEPGLGGKRVWARVPVCAA